jgi:methyl-accepting chemotaxis protein
VMAAMAQMCERLAGLVGGMRQHSDTISTSAQEIATGNQDLSRRTARQAAELQQTVATVAQFTEALRETAQAAGEAGTLGEAAVRGASDGAALVQEAVRTMDGIAQSSRRIGEITSVIDGIAFQTNILALNAAVEAARAGEQGRGFAVVAGEVRLLARRSGEAARQIHQLISSSGTQVQQGARLVGEAGEAMQDIVRRVQGVTELIGRIRQAAHAQASGIEQVHHTLGDLDGVTQQNAALVEQASAAADSLSQCAGELVALVQDIRVASAPA